MKKVMAWVKSNVLIVVLSAIIIITLPVAFFGASWWGGKIKKDREELVSKRFSEIQGMKYSYSLARNTPGAPLLEEKRVPNDGVTKFYADARGQSGSESQEVVKSAVDFNRGSSAEAAKLGRTPHTPLIEGLFPRPATEAQVPEMTNRFVAALVHTPARPSVYANMLREVINAGEPLNTTDLGKQLDGERSSRMARLGADTSTGAKLTDSQQSELDQALLELRRRAHLSRASEISVYATLDALPITGRGTTEGSLIPSEIPSQPPSVSRAFQWQMDYWLIRDLLSAVRVANGTRGGVADSVVKRIDRIVITAPFAGASSESSSDPSAAPAAPAITVEQLTGLVPMDPMYSVTGRKSSLQNPLYDVRTARMTVVMSAPRMKEFLNALAKTNFMTVVGLTLAEVNVREDLDRGYYYGPESVVQATVTIETVWLRAWTQEYFPSGVKKRLSIPLKEGERPDDGDMASGGGPIDPGSGFTDPSAGGGGEFGGGEGDQNMRGRRR